MNEYSGSVNVGGAAGTTTPPLNCSANPASILPSTTGANFRVNAAGNPGDYAFNLHAAGNDPATVTHDFSLTLHIVDFNLSPPSPSTVSVTPGNTSAAASFSVSAAGSFAGIVTLSCSNLPTGAACKFQPSTTVSPTNGNPVSATLNITTSSSTPLGTFPITISATTPGAPAKTKTITLVVGSSPDYSLNISNPSLVASVNLSAQFNGTLSAINSYPNAVALSCGPDAPPTCTVNPTSATTTSADTSFTVTVSNIISQRNNFDIVCVINDSATIPNSAAVSFITIPSQNFDFTMGNTPISVSLPAGLLTIFSLDV